jgi:uncharacterized membrane protein
MGFFPDASLLTKQELKKIADTIAEAERTTSGEIRVSIRKRRAWKERSLTLHEYALKNFYELGMDKTKRKSGVLLFFSLSERAFRIVADEGINKKVSDKYWNELAASLTSHFKEKNFCHGICMIVQEIGRTLSREFPRHTNDTDELTNDVSTS